MIWHIDQCHRVNALNNTTENAHWTWTGTLMPCCPHARKIKNLTHWTYPRFCTMNNAWSQHTGHILVPPLFTSITDSAHWTCHQESTSNIAPSARTEHILVHFALVSWCFIVNYNATESAHWIYNSVLVLQLGTRNIRQRSHTGHNIWHTRQSY